MATASNSLIIIFVMMEKRETADVEEFVQKAR